MKDIWCEEEPKLGERLKIDRTENKPSSTAGTLLIYSRRQPLSGEQQGD